VKKLPFPPALYAENVEGKPCVEIAACLGLSAIGFCKSGIFPDRNQRLVVPGTAAIRQFSEDRRKSRQIFMYCDWENASDKLEVLHHTRKPPAGNYW
jgi:hypothetical protein